jgi:hypothetical protein
MKLFINSENHYIDPFQRPCSGDFDPKNTYRKPPVILKIVHEAGYCVYTGENQPIRKARRKSTMTEKKSWDRNFDAAFGTKFRTCKNLSPVLTTMNTDRFLW